MKGWIVGFQERLERVQNTCEDLETHLERTAAAEERRNTLLEQTTEKRWGLVTKAADSIAGFLAGGSIYATVFKGSLTVSGSLLVVGAALWILDLAGVPVSEILALIPGLDALFGTSTTEPPDAG